jgi:deoxyribodipyrimidine photolyase-related protein
MKTIRLILGDQLNEKHTWFEELNEDVVYLMAEVRQETDYAPHHIQKVVGIFVAMRSFAHLLREAGHNVQYISLDAANNPQIFKKIILDFATEIEAKRFEYQEPDEYRLDIQLMEIAAFFDHSNVSSTEHFLTERNQLEAFFEGKKTYLMESFYRSMRKEYSILMEGSQPVTGKWNYDASNRKKMPKDHRPMEALLFEKDVQAIVTMIKSNGVKTIGEIDAERFIWPTSRAEALELFDFFLENGLMHFGDFQDAMTTEYWAVYHSRISFAMNIKLVSPLEIIQKAEAFWHANEASISISQVEGYIRQILGWREYMRGVYWAKMPDFAQLNFFDHDRELPSWFWTGETKMKCMRHSIKQSLEYAYAHHIQRLMVTGNFALLAGINPDEVDQWYLGIYIDAFEWVEITNTRGMSQFADGGIVGTKPYVSSANYIHKMGNYCSNCSYKKDLKTGEGACPFNSLYWHFYARNRDKLEKNPRIGMAYRTWDKMDPTKRNELLDQAEGYLDDIENL